MGKRHAQNARALGWEVTIHDTEWEKVQRDPEADAFSIVVAGDAETDGPFAAVIVATPASQHAQFLLQHSADMPVLVEKPLVLQSSDLDRVAASRLSMVGCNWRYHADYRDVRESWPFPPVKIHLDCNTDYAQWPGKDYADPLLECGAHEIDTLRWLRSGADLTLVSAGPQDGYEGAWLQFDTGDRIDLRWNAPPSRRLIARWADRPEQAIWPLLGEALEASYRDELADFLRSVEAGTPSTRGATFEDGLAVLRICEQVRERIGA